ncbi:helix-turn-helix domain-containing protein [Lihuaxuella thermophila]|uniref:Helix-turn-helix domain-containing protein n=1 Tax=Lihuaxuella thermophila TaxID=1173111 RepID=A0A1H8EN08_9BACL|nr:helix-turn-helix transcriptional regulator [Lihuaxuella thermophila]SEN20766.1 Helix-turn-helix domain-containing protein [Lihuaxuella thermophila]
MKNFLLRAARRKKGWSQQQLADFAQLSLSTIERAERGEPIRVDSIERLCRCLQKTPEQLGLLRNDTDRIQTLQFPGEVTTTSFSAGALSGTAGNPASLCYDDLLSIYAQGIAACQDLYFSGCPYQVEAILPLYRNQTALLARQPGPLQKSAARLASQAYQLTCELATDREDFGTAQQAGQQAFSYAQLAGDTNLQVNALISLANLGWHLSSAQPGFIRKHSKRALQAYKHAVSLLGNNVTPLLKGRTYAGIAEVYAMRGQFQESMRAMGLAYEHFPMKPENDPAYPYLRASRYALYVFGDAQSRLLLGQPKEADKALIAMQKETNDPEIEPITRLDMLYYQAHVQIQQGELEQSTAILTEAAELAKDLGSRLYFNKLITIYNKLYIKWPREKPVVALEEVFQPW